MSALISYRRFTGGFARNVCSQGRTRRTVRYMRNLQGPHLQCFTVSCSTVGDVVQLVRTLLPTSLRRIVLRPVPRTPRSVGISL